MGKLTISMAIFNSYVKLPEGILYDHLNRIGCHQVIFGIFGNGSVSDHLNHGLIGIALSHRLNSPLGYVDGVNSPLFTG